MGLPNPQDPVPAYDDVFTNHPVNRYSVTSSSSAYAAIPQDDDVELHAQEHNHHSLGPTPAPEHALAGLSQPKPHLHCEFCDVQLAAQRQIQAKKHCCTMVAATFMTAFVCISLAAILISWAGGKCRRD